MDRDGEPRHPPIELRSATLLQEWARSGPVRSPGRGTWREDRFHHGRHDRAPARCAESIGTARPHVVPRLDGRQRRRGSRPATAGKLGWRAVTGERGRRRISLCVSRDHGRGAA